MMVRFLQKLKFIIRISHGQKPTQRASFANLLGKHIEIIHIVLAFQK